MKIKTENYSANTETRIFLELSNDETFVDAISDDLNEDGVEDQIIAVKNYWILFIPDHFNSKSDNSKMGEG